MIEIKNSEELNKLINDKRPLLVDFYADWCGPCQVVLPILEELSKKHGKEVTIAKVNVDKNRELAQQFSVRSIPSIFIFNNGEVVDLVQGLQSSSDLERKIQMLKAA